MSLQHCPLEFVEKMPERVSGQHEQWGRRRGQEGGSLRYDRGAGVLSKRGSGSSLQQASHITNPLRNSTPNRKLWEQTLGAGGGDAT